MNLWVDNLPLRDLCPFADMRLCKWSVTCLTNVQMSIFLVELLAKRLPSGETRIMKPSTGRGEPPNALSEGGHHDRKARRRCAFSEMAYRRRSHHRSPGTIASARGAAR